MQLLSCIVTVHLTEWEYGVIVSVKAVTRINEPTVEQPTINSVALWRLLVWVFWPANYKQQQAAAFSQKGSNKSTVHYVLSSEPQHTEADAVADEHSLLEQLKTHLRSWWRPKQKQKPSEQTTTLTKILFTVVPLQSTYSVTLFYSCFLTASLLLVNAQRTISSLLIFCGRLAQPSPTHDQ